MYLESDTVSSFLSSVEDGVYNSEDRETEISGGPNPYAADAYDDSSNYSDRRRRKLEQTGPSRFARLVQYVSDDPDEVLITDLREPSRLAEGVFCQLSGKIVIAQSVAAMTISKEFLELGRRLNSLGVTAVKEEDLKNMEAVSEASEAIGNRINVTMQVQGLTDLLVLPLRKDIIAERFADLNGNLTVFGRVSQMIRKGEFYNIIELPGEGHMSRQQRRAMSRKTGTNSAFERDRRVMGPAVVLNVIALFR
ncbi:hypothetical protein [Amycolatopsis sp. lyj-346]|uniref:DUF6414 family protein n=1 Tax=Amycolatopsis sp. lyj-346 TaxID=2789289 RepID=UPI00397A7E0E